jgi:hypothetical protein
MRERIYFIEIHASRVIICKVTGKEVISFVKEEGVVIWRGGQHITIETEGCKAMKVLSQELSNWCLQLITWS